MGKIELIDVNKMGKSSKRNDILLPQKKSPIKWIKRIALLGLFIFLVFVAWLIFILKDLPSIEALQNYSPSMITEVFDANGQKIGEFFKERRIVTPLEEIPLLLRQAFVASEDSRFYEHKGLDYQGIARAFMKNLMAGSVKQGGSTITQQVAKSLLLTPEKKLSRKIKEAILAFRMEKNLSKHMILYLYLNQIYLGHGAYGVTAAAENYFGKTLDELNLSEMSMLAGLVQAPSRYNPFTHLERAKKRQRYVLEKMLENHFISSDEMQKAFDTELKLFDKVDFSLLNAPYFTEFVRRYLVDKYTNENVLSKGYKVYTTLDLNMQLAAKKALSVGLSDIDKRQGYRGPLEYVESNRIETYIEELSKNKNEPDPTLGTIKAIVIKVDDENQLTRISTGEKEGTILLEDMKWARKPNPDVHFDWAHIKSPSTALKVGDIILVKETIYEKLPERFKKSNEDLSPFYTLEQEPLVEGAIVSMEVQTGNIKSMIGGLDYTRSEFNRAVQAQRQPGSAFKPIIYSAAIDKGYTAANMIVDAPIIYDDPLEEKTWKPKNYGGKFHGKTILRDALIKSRNVLTIKIVEDIGLDYLIDYSHKLGVVSELTRDNTLALGSSVMTPLELTKIYAVFASGGKIVNPVFIEKVEDSKGNLLEEKVVPPYLLLNKNSLDKKDEKDTTQNALGSDIEKPEEENLENSEDKISKDENSKEGSSLHYLDGAVISQETAYIMTHLLSEVVHFGTGQRVKALGRPAAGKTGTTNDNVDAWFIGYTPDIVTGVWVGFDEKKPLGKGEAGGRTASPIWLSYMQEALKDKPVKDFSVPPGIVFVQIDPNTGKLASDKMRTGIFEAFIDGTQPKEATQTEVDSQIKNFFIE